MEVSNAVSELKEAIKDHFKRKWPFTVFTLGAMLAFWCWLVSPVITDPYVRIRGHAFTLLLHCIPSEVEINAFTPNLRPTSIRFQMRSKDGVAPYQLKALSAQSSEGSRLVISVPVAIATDAVKLLSAGATASLTLDFQEVSFIDVSEIYISPAKVADNRNCVNVSGKELLSSIADSATLKHYLLPQEKLGDLLHRINEALGVILICVLIAWSVWLALWLSYGIGKYFQPEKGVMKSNQDRFSQAHPSLKSKGMDAVLTADYLQLQRRLVFARVMGPALGFLLTVSSLIAGLHSGEQGSGTTFGLMAALQLALVATFSGLALRVIAECAIRIHRHVLDKQLRLFFESRTDRE